MAVGWSESTAWVRHRTDLLIIWPYRGGEQRVVIELKLLYKSLEDTIKQGLEQTWASMDRSGAETGHLVIIDQSEARSWEEQYRDKVIKVWGM